MRPNLLLLAIAILLDAALVPPAAMAQQPRLRFPLRSPKAHRRSRRQRVFHRDGLSANHEAERHRRPVDVSRALCRSRSGPSASAFIGGGSAAGLAALLLATPAAATIGEIVHVLDPVAYAVSLLIIIAACLVAASIPATRAARLDPMRTLRQE